MTLTEYKDAADKYIAFLPSSKADAERTRVNYARVLTDFENYLKAHTNGNEISTVDVLGYRQAIRDRGASQNTARQYLTDLSAFFNWCVRVKICAESIVQIDDIPELTEIEYTLLERWEIDKILAYRPRKETVLGARNRAIVTILLQAGLRNSELRALTLGDLDFKACTITVKHGKGNKSRTAPFPALSRDAVTEYLKSGIRPKDAAGNALLFGTYANENGRSNGDNAKEWHEIGSNAVNDIVKRYVKKLTGKEVHAHTLRHAAASLWDDLNVPMRTIQQGLGHNSIRTTERIYVTVLNKHKAAMDLTAAFGG